jgi:hypothetical protein
MAALGQAKSVGISEIVLVVDHGRPMADRVQDLAED